MPSGAYKCDLISDNRFLCLQLNECTGKGKLVSGSDSCSIPSVLIRVVEELLWFLKGHTDARILAAKDVHIWDANGTKEFLATRGLDHREEGDLGPVYGFQWRHFGADYGTCTDNYEVNGIMSMK